jgi:hypothetical protein
LSGLPLARPTASIMGEPNMRPPVSERVGMSGMVIPVTEISTACSSGVSGCGSASECQLRLSASHFLIPLLTRRVRRRKIASYSG